MKSRLWNLLGMSLLLGALAGGMAACKSMHASARGGWRPIFDGSSTNGWQMVGPGHFTLEDGELITHGGMGMLWYTREKFGDCRLRIMFQPTSSQDNSGVFIRIPEPPRDEWFAVHRGYEVQIENNGDEWHRTGCLYSMSRARNVVSARVNEWNVMLITLEGPRTRVEVNGRLVTDFTEGEPVPPRVKDYEPERGPRPVAGFIGLQNHDDKGRVRFKEVSVAPLK